MSRWTFGISLWLAGMLGVIPMTISVVPALLAGKPLRLPLWLIETTSCLQSAVLVALAVWAGVALAGRVGLSALAFRAFAAREPIWPALRAQLLPGAVGGVAGGTILLVCARYTPASLAAAKQSFDPSLLVRVLYGGLTEELLLRWGFMSLVLWSCWKLAQTAGEPPRLAWVWTAILGGALLFAAGHLPTAAHLTGKLTADVVAYVLIGNAAFGVLAGWLYWRFGLETAMLCHALAHVLAVSVNANP